MVRNHLRSNIIGYLALFFAMTGTAIATHPGGANTIDSGDIINGEVRTADIGNDEVSTTDLSNGGVATVDIADDAVTHPKIPPGAVRTNEISNGGVQSVDVLDNSLTALDLATDSVGSSEIAADSVGSSEIQTGVVGADELDTVHEHFGPATDITDGTAHDGAYSLGSATVACGFGEDLLSVSVDWTASGGHNERHTVGVPIIDRTTDPETATVEVSYDGGATTATFVPVATCIF